MPDTTTLAAQLDDARQDLLELSTRNRLLSTPRHRKRTKALEIVDEKSAHVFDTLVHRGRSFTFLAAEDAPKPDPDLDTPGLGASSPSTPDQAQDPTLEPDPEPQLEPEPEVEPDSAGAIFKQPDEPVEELPEDEPDTDQPLPQHTDRKLQTSLSSEDLQKRLLRTFYDARTTEQEQGVNTLYLALGFLKWYEDDHSEKARYAPLLLIPARLDRKNARTRFSLSYTEEELTTNLSLQAKLKAEFNLDLPDVPEITEEFKPDDYFAQVRAMIEKVDRWEVCPDDVVLSFFSFSKFLMYRDLDRESWPAVDVETRAIERHPLLSSLLGREGFADEPPVVDEDASLDSVIPPRDMIHVVQADTSQSIAVEGVRRGRNMVIQGPPGTGKSQTIANLIAAAVKEGKKVLFVAEKMAALEVVKRRLANVGLGDMCLELHSHKAKKRAVLDDLEHTLSLGQPKAEATDAYFQQLTATRDALNAHADALHTPIAPNPQTPDPEPQPPSSTGITPYHAIGQLVRLRAAGAKPATFELDDPLSWSPAQTAAVREALDELLEQLAIVGDPTEHPWRGAMVDAMLPMDLQRLAAQLPDASGAIRGAEAKARQLADAIEVDERVTPALTTTLAHRARRLAEAPMMDKHAITHDAWAQQGPAITQLVEAGGSLSIIRKQLDGVVTEAAWGEAQVLPNFERVRRDLATHGRSLFRIFKGDYRKAKSDLQAFLVGKLPGSLEERLKIVDTILEGQKAIRTIEQYQVLGQYAFGSLFLGKASDWDTLAKIHGWNRRNEEKGDGLFARALIARLDDPTRLTALANDADAAAASAVRTFNEAIKPVQLDLDEAFRIADLNDVPLGRAAQRLDDWAAHPDGLTRWINFRSKRSTAEQLGMTQLVEALADGSVPFDPPQAARDAFDMAYYEALLREAFAQHPELARFTGQSHEHTLEAFRKLDSDRLDLARQEVALQHFKGLPHGGSDVGQVGILRREFQKKRRHLPLRTLLKEAGLAIQAIKPVFMMSPMSVAQYLEPGGLSFDLMLMDEASQVRPVDALGAVARCQQIVVVGDDKQLPPTRFFDAMVGASDEDEPATELDTSDLESILGLCTAQNIPTCMLRWHYRSKHPSLIAVSNREFYDNRLYVIPSPRRHPDDLGLRFHRITEGYFDRGGSATHRVEAQIIAAAVIEHARSTPELTLGVGAFSVGQRDAILDELELLRRDNADVDRFFAEDTEEPFFVKNLENIQGDERDVIFISVGYGPDKDGKVSMNFGPLSNDGGERRLNVLITRAKRRLEVFSSLMAEDIDLDRVSRRGPQAFRTFLRYAQTGTFDTAHPDEHNYASVFERQVGESLKARGYDVEPCVGEKGFYVDLAVVDPDQPGRYLLGITCDGPGYGSARSARERDASREGVLRMMGWRVHRLWSIDWFNRPQEQLDAIIADIEAAKAGHAPKTPKPMGDDEPIIEREAAADPGEADRFAGIPVQPYKEAKFKKIPRKDIDDLNVFERMDLVSRIVEAEAPVHGSEVIRRAADIYRVERVTSKISDLLQSALDDSANAGKLEEGDGFYTRPGVSSVEVVRDRSDVESSGLRKPEHLPPAELRFALQQVVKVAIGVSREDAIIEASRLLGFASTRSNLREALDQALRGLLDREYLVERDGALFVE